MPTHPSPLPATAYPIATFAAYGPDNKRATKLVVAVFPSPGLAKPSEVRTWKGSHFDIREDPGTAAEVTQFVTAHGVKQVVNTENIIGCPHEAGVDYPKGDVCPHCTYWAGRKRATDAAFQAPPATPIRVEPKAGRNEPCPCGSGKKFKRCCAA